MVASPAPRPVATTWDPQAWDIALASLDYVRDTVLITCGDDDLIDALIFTTALDANVTPVNRDPGLQVAYGGVEISAPDELRRPVSINAVAQSLRLPFETVRRRFQGLAREGLCLIGPQGVIVPRSADTSPAYIAKQRARYERARSFHQDLAARDILPGAEQAQTWPPAAEPLVRAANRALSEYVLRACNDLIALTGDVLSSLVLLELVLANTRVLSNAELDAWRRAPGQVGRPIRIAALAAPLRLSRETVRRRLNALEAQGFCRRTTGGLVATAPVSVWPGLARLAEANQANLQRLFNRLRQLGVVATSEPR